MTYYPTQDLEAQAQAPLPVLRIAPNMPVQVTAPIRPGTGVGSGTGSGDGQLNSAALGKRIAALLNQKYGAPAGNAIDNLGTLGDEPLINEILAQNGNTGLDNLGTLGDEAIINSMGIGGT